MLGTTRGMRETMEMVQKEIKLNVKSRIIKLDAALFLQHSSAAFCSGLLLEDIYLLEHCDVEAFIK